MFNFVLRIYNKYIGVAGDSRISLHTDGHDNDETVVVENNTARILRGLYKERIYLNKRNGLGL